MIPKLRFPEFKDEWQEKRLGDVSDFCSYGLNSAAKKFDGRNKYIRITDINEESREFSKNNLTSPSIINDKYLLDDDDIIFARTGASVGKTYLYNKNDGKVYFAGFLIKFSIKYANPYFIFLQTLQPKYKNWVKVMSTRSGQPGINADEYKTFKVVLSSIKEQEKIADFLRGGDERMTSLEKKVDAMREYKKGVMSAIFSGKLRFKDENGNPYPDWEEKRLGELLKERKEYARKGGKYEHISLTKDGVVPKSDRYERDFLVGSDDKKYRITRINDICYNPANLKFGVIARNKYKNGIFSPIYVTYEVKGADVVFMEYYLTRWDFINYARRYEEGTVYERTAVGPEDFARLMIKLPCLAEQRKIADFLSAIDHKIELEQIRLDRTKDFKKGLLQRMFV